MANGDESRVDLPDNRRALSDYLEALLEDVEEAEPGAVADGSERQGSEEPASSSSAQEPIPAAREEVSPQPAAAARQEPDTPGTRVAERQPLPQPPMPEVAPSEAPGAPSSPAEPERPATRTGEAGAARLSSRSDGPGPPPEGIAPDWARPFFQALIVEVGPLRLAVPLVKLRRVVRWQSADEVEPTVGQPVWMHGLLDHRGRYVQVVDTSQLVLPPDRRPPPEQRQGGKIIIVGDGSWGLACREVGDVLKLEPRQVDWRSAARRRPWLAGTVREHLCALIEPDAFVQMLEREGDVGGTLASPPAHGQNGAAAAR